MGLAPGLAKEKWTKGLDEPIGRDSGGGPELLKSNLKAFEQMTTKQCFWSRGPNDPQQRFLESGTATHRKHYHDTEAT